MTMKVYKDRMLTKGRLFVTFLLVTSMLVFFMYGNDEDADEARSSMFKRAGEAKIQVTHNDIDALKIEIERLKGTKNDFDKKLASLGTQLSTLKLYRQSSDQNDRHEDPDMTALRDAELANPETPEEELQRRELKIQQKIEVLETTVLSEEADHEWADSIRNTFHDAIQREEIKGVNLVEADCRTTMCRIDLTVDTTEEGDDSMAFLDLLEGPGFFHLNETDGQAVLYMAREGFSLPQTNE